MRAAAEQSRTRFLAFLLLSTISYPYLRSTTCQNTIGNWGTPNSTGVRTILGTASRPQKSVTQCADSNSGHGGAGKAKEGPSLHNTKVGCMGGNASWREYCQLRNRELANRWLFVLHDIALIMERQAFSRGLHASG
jgi:hypothetical protein